MSGTVRRWTAAAAVSLGACLAGCGGPPSSPTPGSASAVLPSPATGEVVATPTRAVDPTAEPSDCLTIASYSSAAPPTTDVMRQVDVIAPGTVDRVDPAEWSTPGNVRPDMAAVAGGRSSAIIWRPVDVTFEAPWKGALRDVARTIVRGGTVGCDSYLTDDDPNLIPGDRYVLFLFEVTDSTGSLAGIMNVVEAWPIRADGTVVRPVEEPIELRKLRVLLTDP